MTLQIYDQVKIANILSDILYLRNYYLIDIIIKISIQDKKKANNVAAI